MSDKSRCPQCVKVCVDLSFFLADLDGLRSPVWSEHSCTRCGTSWKITRTDPEPAEPIPFKAPPERPGGPLTQRQEL